MLESVKATLGSPKVHTAAILIATLALLWLFFRGSNLGEIKKSLLSAKPVPILWSLAATMATYLIRAIRWQGLLLPLGRAGLANCFSATVIGFMVNFLAPGRLGEIARPYLLARREGFSASGAFATILLERMFDLVTVVFFVAFWLLAGPKQAGSEEIVSSLKIGGVLGLGFAVVALLSLFLFARYPEPSMAVARWFLRVLPHRAAARMARFLETFREGLGVLVHGWGLVKAFLLSVLLWLAICLSFWLAARALSVELGFGDTFLVIGFLTVGVALPTPGAIGGYHYMCSLALTTLFGIATSPAAAVALVAHAISFLPVTILGILLFVKAGLTFGQFK
jgi:glycosyltransferase 2 family protein